MVGDSFTARMGLERLETVADGSGRDNDHETGLARLIHLRPGLFDARISGTVLE